METNNICTLDYERNLVNTKFLNMSPNVENPRRERFHQMSQNTSECWNQNTNKIKCGKYLKHNIQIELVVRLYFRYLTLIHPIKNISVKLDDGMHGSDIITFGVVVMENFNLISVVFTANRKTEIMFLSEK